MSSSQKPLATVVFHASNPGRIAIGAIAVTLIGAAYCAGLWALSNGATGWPSTLFWASATVLPWYVAYEANKHVLHRGARPLTKVAAIALVLGVALVTCGAADWSIARSLGHHEDLAAVHVYRHLPETAAIIILTVCASVFGAEAARPTGASKAELPIAPARIELVRGAGNYAELEAAERTLLLRATMGQVEAALIPHGFVRINRSVIVPKRRIASMAVRGGRQVVRLTDGSEFRVGSTFSPKVRRTSVAGS
jgi:DNA-binding LytR/AlgR family response regulator